MYEVINKELKLESCGIGDLTMDVVSGMLKQWDDGSSISTLTLFYLPKTDTIVLNRDNKNYDTYREFAEMYLKCDEQERKEIRTKIDSSEKMAMKEELRILDAAINHRKNIKDMFMLEHQTITEAVNNLSISMMKEITNSTEDYYCSMYKAFQYGVMQGKRLERNKKRQSAKA